MTRSMPAEVRSRTDELQACLGALRDHEAAYARWVAGGRSGEAPPLELPRPDWMTAEEFARVGEYSRGENWRMRQRLIERSAHRAGNPARRGIARRLRGVLHRPRLERV